jgi:hypothetical protein
LDRKLADDEFFVKRIPFTGDHRSFCRWDPSRNTFQCSSIDHLVWNGKNIPSCSLTTDGFFSLDHIPIIVDTRMQAQLNPTKITRMVRNHVLKTSDKGACRKFVTRICRQADKLFLTGSPSPTLEELTRSSVDISNDIHKKRNNLLSSSLWSPIASLLALRCSALGSTIRIGLEGRSPVLKKIITRLARDEKQITFNEDELDWLYTNFIQTAPFEWNEWRNEFFSLSKKQCGKVREWNKKVFQHYCYNIFLNHFIV